MKLWSSLHPRLSQMFESPKTGLWAGDRPSDRRGSVSSSSLLCSHTREMRSSVMCKGGSQERGKQVAFGETMEGKAKQGNNVLGLWPEKLSIPNLDFSL